MKNFMLGLFLVMMATGVALAQKAEQAKSQLPEEDDTFTIATVNGEITGITKRNMSVVYDKDYDTGTEYEMMVLLDNKTQVKHKRDLGELKVGDLVSIEYEKAGEKSKHKAMATTITFIQSGVTNLMSEDRQSSASDADVTP